jgi:cell division protein FtsQ
MDRSFAGRLGIGGITRPQPRTAKPRKAGQTPRGGTGTRPGRIDWTLEQLARPLAAAARLSFSCFAAVRARRRLRIALLVLLIAAPLLAGGWLWLRQSSFVSVQRVHVSGARGADAHAIDAALTAAARRMSTLAVDSGALRAAVAAYPAVSGVRVRSHFPHGLSIDVIEQPAVAALTVAGTKTAVAANGVVLGPGAVSGSLPLLTGASLPAPGQRLHDTTLLGAVTLLGAAPSPLAKRVTRAYSSSKGLTFELSGGLRAYFGDATRAHAKWLALAAVLAEQSSAGASYVDVRVPERPAAGGLTLSPEGTAEGESSTTAPTSSESSEALAEGLSSAAGTSSPASTSASQESEEASPSTPAPTSESESTAPSGSEASGTESSEASG